MVKTIKHKYIIISIIVLIIGLSLFTVFKSKNKNPYKFDASTINQVISESRYDKFMKNDNIIKFNDNNGKIFTFPQKKNMYNESVIENIYVDDNNNIVRITRNFRIHNQEDLHSNQGTFCSNQEKCNNRANEFIYNAISEAEKKYGLSYKTKTSSDINIYTWEINDNLYYRIEDMNTSTDDSYYHNINCSYFCYK